LRLTWAVTPKLRINGFGIMQRKWWPYYNISAAISPNGHGGADHGTGHDFGPWHRIAPIIYGPVNPAAVADNPIAQRLAERLESGRNQ
jgi:hypothetical protein